MIYLVNNQAFLFIIFTINGMLIGILFDFFRILRKSFKTTDIITYIEDIFFWIITGLIIIYSMYTFTDGELRFFMILGMIIGVLIYMLTISKYFIKFSLSVLNILKKVFGTIIKIISSPFKIIHKVTEKIIFRPISNIFISISKNINKFVKKMKNNKGFFIKKENII